MISQTVQTGPLSSHLWTDTKGADGRGHIEVSGQGDVSEAGLETLGPDGQPGQGVEVQARGQAQDDRPVPVAPEAGHGPLLVSKLHPVGRGTWARAHHEEGVWLVAAEYQVLDHQSLAVDGHHVPAEGPPPHQRPQDVGGGQPQLEVIRHQDAAYHLLKCHRDAISR